MGLNGIGEVGHMAAGVYGTGFAIGSGREGRGT